jgi:hypothetical protein
MTTLIALTHMMESYSHAVAPTRECAAWRLFIEECRCDLHRLPWSDNADYYVPEGFAQYWSLVSMGESRDFDPKSGDYLAGAWRPISAKRPACSSEVGPSVASGCATVRLLKE